MRNAFVAILIVCSSIIAVVAQKKPEPAKELQPSRAPAVDSAGALPIKRAVLYKNGVGYFEHFARVHGSQDPTIDFTMEQL